MAEGDFIQWTLEDRLADSANGAGKLIDRCIFWHPAGADMQFGYLAVVTLKDGE